MPFSFALQIMEQKNPPFVAGKIFKKSEKWNQLIDELETNGHEVKKWTRKAFAENGVNIFSNEFFNQNMKSWKFNKKIYETAESIRDAEIKNYGGAINHPDKTKELLDEMLTSGAIRRSTDSDKKDNQFMVNPIDLKFSEEGKARFILHFKLNSGYRKVIQKMANVVKESKSLFDIEELVQYDMMKCYFQFKMRDDVTPAVSFVYEEIFYTFQVLPFGMSMSGLIASTTTTLFLNGFAFMSGCFTLGYVDDFLLNKAKAEGFEEYASGLDIQFKPAKFRSGPQVEFCGYYALGR